MHAEVTHFVGQYGFQLLFVEAVQKVLPEVDSVPWTYEVETVHVHYQGDPFLGFHDVDFGDFPFPVA